MKGLIRGILIGFVAGALITSYYSTWNMPPTECREPIHYMGAK